MVDFRVRIIFTADFGLKSLSVQIGTCDGTQHVVEVSVLGEIPLVVPLINNSNSRPWSIKRRTDLSVRNNR